jgi:predicted metal-binding membrane protein
VIPPVGNNEGGAGINLMVHSPNRRSGGVAVQTVESKLSRERNYLLPLTLLTVAGVGWWSSVATSATMSLTMNSGGAMMALFAWVAMMAAMMLPAVLPVVRLYQRAAERGTAAPVSYFLAGYAVIWSVVGLPVYWVWRQLQQPLAQASPAVGRLAGAVLIGAALYQLSPMKKACLRHCRSPLNFFMRHATNLRRSSGAVKLGARHGLYCLGCCWMLMAVLVALGTMQLFWMAVVAGLIFLEKVTSFGEYVAVGAGVGFFVLGVVLMINPATVGAIT